MQNKYSKTALIIPESRTRPRDNSRLYKRISVLLSDIDMGELFDLYFVTITDGIVRDSENTRDEQNDIALPPKRFPSGRSWISKEQIISMANDQAPALHLLSMDYYAICVYARGSYLQSIRLAGEITGIEFIEMLSEYDLSVLKKGGILWMKMGLRMPAALRAFKRGILHHQNAKEHRQLFFPF